MLPASAPERADSHGIRALDGSDLELSTTWFLGTDSGDDCTLRARRADAMNSFDANHTAVPPVSRRIVLVCPTHIPVIPCRLTIFETIANGPGRFRPDCDVEAFCGVCTNEGDDVARLGKLARGGVSIWTCILHLTSSMGVL